ncbi:MAG: hypothetical protein MK193_03545 [Lentisphaeria bacterium]|nr:hypothetical protein [Lentisphaeria bacterium]
MGKFFSFLFISFSLFGADVYFLPGDAFFHTRLTAKTIQKLKENKDKILTYEKPNEFSMDCGTAGFYQLQLIGNADQLIANLEKTYEKLRAYGREFVEEIDYNTDKKILIETNGLNLFIYNKDFDFTQFMVGLKYNENWVQEYVSFGHERKGAMLNSFLPNYLYRSWRDASLVPPLKSTAKAGAYQGAVNAENIPTIQVKDISFIIVDEFPKNLYDLYFIRTFYVVTADGVKALQLHNHQWKVNHEHFKQQIDNIDELNDDIEGLDDFE